MNLTQLAKVKRRLGISPDDKHEDELLIDLIEDAESYFKMMTKASYVESKYNFMIENVVYKFYVQKGSEGVSSETVDGYSVTYQDLGNLFEPYMAILNKDFSLDFSQRQKGKVLFL